MCEEPYLSKQDMLDQLQAAGISPPHLYSLGFPHNNCGGMCVKAGQAQFELLLRTNRKRYLWHEQQEQEMREMLGDYAILNPQVDGKKSPMSLRAFREQLELQPDFFDKHEWGGCGCAID